MSTSNINENVLVAAGEKIITGMSVSDVGAAMQRFGWADYVVFVCMLLVCVIIGLYFCLIKSSKTAQEYLIGGRTMNTFPIAMSLIASFISGISLLGIPTEIYVYGVQYLCILGGAVLMALIFQTVYLPVFHDLHVTSTYEYLERRFDKRIRLFGSLLFIIANITWLPIVIYVPALAFNQVTGVNVHLITPAVCVICIFYTTIGGLKAVVWTDVIQTMVMLGAMVLVGIKGTLDIGGIAIVLGRNWDSDRIEAPNLDINPLSRHTVWSLAFGGCICWLQNSAITQNMMQRYLSLPTINQARRALWIFVAGIFVLFLMCAYCGLLVYATYHNCDPLTTMLAREKDQLLPLLVMDVLGDYPGLPGLFIAGVFCAALSSLSTGLNSMAAVILEDFYKGIFTHKLSERETRIVMKVSIVFLGAVCVGLVVVVEKLGAVLQSSTSIGAIAAGPSLALFGMGVLLPWVTAKGALVGGLSGLIFMCWICIKAQTAITSGDLSFPEKPVSTDGCHYHFTPKELKHIQLSSNMTDITHTDEIFMLYRLSYLWYTAMGAAFSMVVGLITSYLTKPLDPRDVDKALLAPFIRHLIPARRYPNQPQVDEIIYAYQNGKVAVPEKLEISNVRGPESA